MENKLFTEMNPASNVGKDEAGAVARQLSIRMLPQLA